MNIAQQSFLFRHLFDQNYIVKNIYISIQLVNLPFLLPFFFFLNGQNYLTYILLVRFSSQLAIVTSSCPLSFLLTKTYKGYFGILLFFNPSVVFSCSYFFDKNPVTLNQVLPFDITSHQEFLPSRALFCCCSTRLTQEILNQKEMLIFITQTQ